MSEQFDSRRLEQVTDVTTWDGVARGLERIAQCFTEGATWVQGNLERTEQNLVLHNLLAAAPPYLGLAAREIEGPIQAMALCTRALYDMNLRARHLLQGGDSLETWKGEFARDNIDVLEGILTLSSDTVTSSFRVRFDRNQYSVPWRLVSQRLLIRADDAHVRIYLGPKCVAEHRRSWDVRAVIEAPAHRRELHESRQRDPSEIAAVRFGTVGRRYLETLTATSRSLRRESLRLGFLAELFGTAQTQSAMVEVMRTGHVGVEYVEYVLRHCCRACCLMALCAPSTMAIAPCASSATRTMAIA